MLLTTLLLACGLRADPAPPVDGLVFQVVSPSPGAEVRVPQLPLMVRLTEPFAEAVVEVRLDGVPVTDPLALTSERNNRLGGGLDHLAWLDLSALEPGEHELALSFTEPGGRVIVQRHRFTWDRPEHHVQLRVRDPDGAPVHAQVILLKDGEPVRTYGPDAEAADPRRRDSALRSMFLLDGDGEIWLDEGDYQLIATAGLRRSVMARELRVEADATLDFVLEEEVPTPGWLAADFHVHTGRSKDAFTPDQLRLSSLLASGLDVAVITDHETIGDVEAPLATLARLHEGLWSVPGVEHTLLDPREDVLEGTVSQGHLNAFPVQGEEVAPLPDAEAVSPAGLIDAWRARQEAAPYPDVDGVLLQLNHPRGIHFRPQLKARAHAHALFNVRGFDPDQPLDAEVNAALIRPEPETGTTELAWDAMEIINRFSLKLYRRVRADWFALMRQGVFITGTGNSDTHAAAVELAGFPINLVACPAPERGSALDMGCLVEAVRGGRLSVSTGPVVELELEAGEARAGLGEALRAEDGLVTARLRVRAASWVPVHELRLVVNGALAWSEALPVEPRAGPGEWVREIPLRLDGDAWVLAEAGWPQEAGAPEAPQEALGVYARVAPGYTPLGFTNPIQVDVAALGWEAPGLPDSDTGTASGP